MENGGSGQVNESEAGEEERRLWQVERSTAVVGTWGGCNLG